ncbi:DUF1295-domain-containing protein [Hypoxylon crocopeplum]|nr:DUF1295-domain-containing protein [Hypoxylon crocopeplum]
MPSPMHILDNYYLILTLLVTVGYQLLFFAVAYSFKFDKLTDFAGGTNFAVLAILTLALSGTPDVRQVVATAFLVGWGVRLSLFLLYRVLRTGKDNRFDGTRDRFFPFLGFWTVQMAWVWVVALPVTVLNSPAVRAYQPQPAFGTTRDIAGAVLFGLGFVVESISDVQRFAFRQRYGKAAVCDTGLFYWSRHPNYFGEIILQFAIFMICVSPAVDGPVSGTAFAAQYATIVGPVFLTILLFFVSGLTLSERPGAKKRYETGENWEAYKHYLSRTSILIPFPPYIYEHLPTIVKRTLLLEFPLYVFDPAKHADGPKPQDEAQEQHGDGGQVTDAAQAV